MGACLIAALMVCRDKFHIFRKRVCNGKFTPVISGILERDPVFQNVPGLFYSLYAVPFSICPYIVAIYAQDRFERLIQHIDRRFFIQHGIRGNGNLLRPVNKDLRLVIYFRIFRIKGRHKSIKGDCLFLPCRQCHLPCDRPAVHCAAV